MEQMLEIYAKVALTVGTVCLIAMCVALVVWVVKSIVRSVVEMRYAARVKFTLDHTKKFVDGYSDRIRALEIKAQEQEKINEELRHEMIVECDPFEANQQAKDLWNKASRCIYGECD